MYAASASLRANGSRECAPNDRLREAIHGRIRREDELLRCARHDGRSKRVMLTDHRRLGVIDTSNIHVTLQSKSGNSFQFEMRLPKRTRNRAGWNAMKRGIEI